MPHKINSALLFIFITVVLDTTGLGIIIPVMPALIQELIQGSISQASSYGGWLTFCFALMQFFFAPILGNLSDQYGRRPILLMSLFGFGINYLIIGFAPSMFWLFAGRIVAGITGASHTVAAAYIADVSPAHKKAQNFGLLGAAFGLGFILGPVIGGLLGTYGPKVPFFAAAGLTFLNLIYGYFVVPESLKESLRRKFNWRKANPIGTFKHIASYPSIIALVICMFLINMSAHSVQSTWSYYTMEKFGWTEKMIGLSLGFIGIFLTLVQAYLIRLIIPALGIPKSILYGLICYVISLPAFALADQSWMLFAGSIVYVFAGICGPALQSAISTVIPDNEQGQIQGGLTCVISLTAIMGPLMMTSLFSYFTKQSNSMYLPEIPFIVGAFLALIAFIIAAIFFSKNRAKF